MYPTTTAAAGVGRFERQSFLFLYLNAGAKAKLFTLLELRKIVPISFVTVYGIDDAEQGKNDADDDIDDASGNE